MKLLVMGGDLRCAYMAAIAKTQGMDVAACGLEAAPIPGIEHVERGDAAYAEFVFMMNPFIKGLDVTYSQNTFTWKEALEAIHPGTRLIFFGTNGMPEEIRDGYDVIDLSEDEMFLIENAHLTAEGAIYSAMKKAPFSIYRADCLIIGFGRIGMALARMLTGFGARVTVAARRENARSRARLFGASAVDMQEMKNILPKQRFIFSTPPDRILTDDDLAQISKKAMLIELASAPYGFDMDAAQNRGLNAWLEAGVPGRYAPESAAHILLNAVKNSIEKGGENSL